VEGDRAIVDFSLPDIPADVLPVILDFGLAVTCTQLGKHIGCARPDVALWLCIPELPHHSALRAMVAGPVQFDAPHVRVSIPAKELERRLPGDPHLLELAKAQLEAQLAKVSALLSTDVLVLVRERLSVRLAHDASLERVAADLRLSARTLRRRLSAVGATFHALLDEARRVRAIRDVVETDQAIEHVAQGVGYRDPANFRRAFRRWTGAAPAAFRAERRRPGD
jgi:AraC-like DNA-binding protein